MRDDRSGDEHSVPAVADGVGAVVVSVAGIRYHMLAGGLRMSHLDRRMFFRTPRVHGMRTVVVGARCVRTVAVGVPGGRTGVMGMHSTTVVVGVLGTAVVVAGSAAVVAVGTHGAGDDKRKRRHGCDQPCEPCFTDAAHIALYARAFCKHQDGKYPVPRS